MLKVAPLAKWFTLAPDETVVAQHPANRTQGKRAVGGRLYFTTQHVFFTPHEFDANLGGLQFECALSAITAVGVEPRRFSLLELFSGGLTQRLRVHSGDRVELFVIRRPAERAAELRTLLGREVPETPSPLPSARIV